MLKKIFLIGYVMIWMSCNPTDENSSQISYEMRKVEKEACHEESCAALLLHFPWFIGEGDPDLLNAHIEQQMVMYLQEGEPEKAISLDSAITDFLSEFLAFSQSHESVDQWQLTINSEVTYQNDDLVSLLFDSYSYKGGAHPNSFQMYLNFDTKNQRLLKSEDLVLDKEKLKQLAEEKFRDYHQVDPQSTLEDDGRFFLDSENSFFLPIVMGYNDNAFILFYNPYEIGPYALGPTEIRIPLQDLENVVYGVRD